MRDYDVRMYVDTDESLYAIEALLAPRAGVGAPPSSSLAQRFLFFLTEGGLYGAV